MNRAALHHSTRGRSCAWKTLKTFTISEKADADILKALMISKITSKQLQIEDVINRNHEIYEQ